MTNYDKKYDLFYSIFQTPCDEKTIVMHWYVCKVNYFTSFYTKQMFLALFTPKIFRNNRFLVSLRLQKDPLIWIFFWTPCKTKINFQYCPTIGIYHGVHFSPRFFLFWPQYLSESDLKSDICFGKYASSSYLTIYIFSIVIEIRWVLSASMS